MIDLTRNNIMLDIETLGNNSNSAIIAVGAVRFGEEVQDSFYQIVSLKSSLEAGLKVDADTILWWMEQEDSARKVFKYNTLPLESVLESFAKWIQPSPIVWGNGVSFDNVILGNAYRSCDMEQPWPFWADMCYRTIKNLFPWVKIGKKGIKHNAKDDALNQAEHLIAIAQLWRGDNVPR